MNGFGSSVVLGQAVLVTLSFAEAMLALIAFRSLARKHLLLEYKSLAVILVLMFLAGISGLVTPHMPRTHLAYESYFYWYWSTQTVGSVLMLVFCYGVLKRTLSTGPKWRFLSMRIFGGAVFVGMVLCAVLPLMEHLDSSHLLVAEISELLRVQHFAAFFTALVVFVSMRAFGFRLRNRFSGFGLGLVFSVLSVLPTFLPAGIQISHPYWNQALVSVAICAQLISWIAALSWPEPARQVVSV